MNTFEKFYINGEWVTPSSKNRIAVINPATEQEAQTIILANETDAEKAIVAARAAFKSFSMSTRQDRLELLDKIIAVYEKRIEEVANAISREMGAPLESLAKPMQAGAMLGHLHVAKETLKNYSFNQDIGTTRIQREPIGVCAMITPWNWPLHQIGCKVPAAIAAGCTMILKPSELAPLSAHVFADILHEAGVPAGVFNLVDGDGKVGAYLAAHHDIDFISFTGSTRAGVSVSQAAAESVKKVALELGGKSANILLEDADFDTAVVAGVNTMMLNAGQNCNAPSRMLVPVNRLEEVEKIALETVANVVIGDPNDDKTSMGPVANQAQYNRVQSMIEKGVSEGAKLICGGTGKPEGIDKGFFVRPTIFSAVNNNMSIAREEIFGPVLCIIPYESEEQAVEIANESEYGLSGYVSSKNLEKARKISALLRTGNVHINSADGDFTASFGGYKKSGLGREWGVHGFEEFLEIKSVFGFQQEQA